MLHEGTHSLSIRHLIIQNIYQVSKPLRMLFLCITSKCLGHKHIVRIDIISPIQIGIRSAILIAKRIHDRVLEHSFGPCEI